MNLGWGRDAVQPITPCHVYFLLHLLNILLVLKSLSIASEGTQTILLWFYFFNVFQFSSAQFCRSVVSDSLRPHGLQDARPPSPSPTPGVYSSSCPLSQWCHPTISSSVNPFSSRLQSFPASGSFQMSQFFTSGGQSIGVWASTSVPPMNTQDWSPLGWTGWIAVKNISI